MDALLEAKFSGLGPREILANLHEMVSQLVFEAVQEGRKIDEGEIVHSLAGEIAGLPVGEDVKKRVRQELPVVVRNIVRANR